MCVCCSSFISVLLSSFVELFPLLKVFLFFPPFSCYYTLSCTFVCCCWASVVCKLVSVCCVCVCVCVRRWGLRSLVMSHLSSSLAPRETQVNYLHTNIPTPSKLRLQSRLCCSVCLCPIDDADLYLYLHIFSSSFSSILCPSHFTLSQPKHIRKSP